jgi:glycosyltransferase involved in cell wall biosynthesis
MSLRPPRVLFLVASDWYFHCHRMLLAQRIAAAGYDVHVATPPGRFCGAIQAAGLHHHPIEIDRQGRNPFKDLVTIKRLLDLYRQLDPTLVHHVAVKPIIYGSIAARIAKVPAVVNAMPGMGYIFVSEQPLSRLIRPAVMMAYRLLVNAANSRVILQNPDDMQNWISWRVMRRDRIVLIRGSGIDTATFHPAEEPPSPPLVVLPARLLFFKGVREFVQAARMLKQRGVNARFALVGDGDPGNPASVPPELLHQWQREGIVELFGWHDDMADVLARCHIVCLPSYGEGLPKALMEAAASGKPIVTTDSPGCREVVDNGENGFLVPIRQVEPLAEALARLIGDADLRRRMGARARERALAEFSVDKVAGETLQLYKLLGAKAATAARSSATVA